jgi:hypothetical protein
MRTNSRRAPIPRTELGEFIVADSDIPTFAAFPFNLWNP